MVRSTGTGGMSPRARWWWSVPSRPRLPADEAWIARRAGQGTRKGFPIKGAARGARPWCRRAVARPEDRGRTGDYRVAEKPKNPASLTPPAAAGGSAPPPPGAGAAAPSPAAELSWRSTWQMPALIGAVLLLAGGVT